MRSGIVAALLALAAAAAAADTSPSDSPPLRVVVAGDTVTATLRAVPLDRVLSEIARQTGAELVGHPAPARDVTGDLHAIPLNEALHRLLGPWSFTLTYTRDGHLKRILIGGGPSEGSAAGIAGATRPSAGTRERADGGASTVERTATGGTFPGASPVAVQGRLARVLGTNLAPFDDVWQAALTNEDRRVRAMARRAAIRALTADPEVHESWAAATAAAPVDALIAVLRAIGGTDARELALAFARYGRSDDVARTMRRAVDQMRTPAGATGG